MDKADAIIAVLADHDATETVVRKRGSSVFPFNDLNVAGEGCHPPFRAD